MRASQFLSEGIGDLFWVIDKVGVSATDVGQGNEELFIKVQPQPHGADDDPCLFRSPGPRVAVVFLLRVAVCQYHHAADGVRCGAGHCLFVAHLHASCHKGLISQVYAIQTVDGPQQLLSLGTGGIADHQQSILSKGNQREAVDGPQMVSHNPQCFLCEIHVAGGVDLKPFGDLELPHFNAIYRLLFGHALGYQLFELRLGEDRDRHRAARIDDQAQVERRQRYGLYVPRVHLDQRIDQVPLPGDREVGVNGGF